MALRADESAGAGRAPSRAASGPLASGVVDVLGSDHAPHTREEKDHAYPDTHSGMTGVQTLVPTMLDHVNAGRLSLQRFVDLTSHGPQRLFGIRDKGRIAVGYDADLTIVDIKRQETITNAWIESRCGWTPYDGGEVTGWPVGTFVRGRKVMWEGAIAGPHVASRCVSGRERLTNGRTLTFFAFRRGSRKGRAGRTVVPFSRDAEEAHEGSSCIDVGDDRRLPLHLACRRGAAGTCSRG